jgi:Tfp pilus tip-associated adhesin PilY1
MLRNVLVLASCIVASAAPAYAQLDPLLMVKDSAPFVLLAVDTPDPVARAAIYQAIRMNQDDVQFGLLAMRVSGPSVLVRADDEESNERIQQLIGGIDVAAPPDTRIADLLSVVQTEAARLLSHDTNCTPAVAVLITSGVDATVSNVIGTLPIYVIAIAPDPNAPGMASLKKMAADSGGQFIEITPSQIAAALASPDLWPSPVAGAVIVPELVAAMNLAAQQGLAGETQIGSPVIGTVNLDNARGIDGASLANSIVMDGAGDVIPQRSNVMVTTALILPGARASIRAFRQYAPVADATQRSGYKFIADGTPLWVARTPVDPDKRNLYTAKPDGTVIPFATIDAPAGSLAVLAGLMNLSVSDAVLVINAVRAAPLGAIIDSTPAIMNPPSLDPPPDDDYPAFAAANKSRRTLIWVGTNAGILEGIDARLGVEAWGFIPANLLPKLKRIRLGQGLTQFQYFVDGSAKIADVKIDGTWRTHLIIGEGAGGVCYQSFDVTMAGLFDDARVAPDEDDMDRVLAYFSDSGRIRFNWAFPRYTSFDPAATVWDGNLDASVQTGDLKPTASAIEKSVGQTWSDPAVGQMVNASGPFSVLVGSGFLPYATQQQVNRGGTIAGTTFYAINAKDGTVYDSKDVGSDARSEATNDCADRAHLNAGESMHQAKQKKLFACNTIKNALQSGPVAAGPANSRYITRAYSGDLDGRVWRFDIDIDTATHRPVIVTTTRLFESGPDQPIVGSMASVNAGGAAQYIFFGTGSDRLPPVDISTTYHLIGVLDAGTGAGIQAFSHALDKTSGKTTDEKVSASPSIAGDVVFFTTTTFKPAKGCKAADANLYALTFIGGAAYDTTGDNKVDQKDSVVVKTITGERATAPAIVDQHLVLGTTSKVAVFGDPARFNNGVGQAGVRVLSWREVR